MVASLIAGVIAWRVEAAAEHDEAEIRRKDGGRASTELPLRGLGIPPSRPSSRSVETGLHARDRRQQTCGDRAVPHYASDWFLSCSQHTLCGSRYWEHSRRKAPRCCSRRSASRGSHSSTLQRRGRIREWLLTVHRSSCWGPCYHSTTMEQGSRALAEKPLIVAPLPQMTVSPTTTPKSSS
jgi:hypothetical protein